MADKVSMKALDTLHISNVQADNICEGETFEVPEDEAKRLEDRGLAKRVGAKAEKAAPANKMEAEAPANKTISAAVAGSSSRVAAKRKGK